MAITSFVRNTLLLTAMVFVSSLNVVAFKRMGYAMGPYPFFILLAISALFVPALGIPLFWVKITSGGFVSNHVSESWSYALTLRNFAILGLCNAVNGICVVFSNPYTPGFMQSLLSTMIVPSTLIFSVAMLKSKFSHPQLAGVALILCGQILQVGAIGGGNGRVSVFWAFVFAGGQLPMALCAVFQQLIFSSQKVNVLFMLAWTNIFQFLWLVVLAPLAAVTPGFGSTTLSDLASQMNDAWLCTQNLVPEHPECCEAAFWMFTVCFCMLLGTCLQAWVVKVASAALAIVASTLVTPVSALCFTSPLLMGPFAEHLAPSTWTCLVMILFGLVLYRLDDLRPTPANAPPLNELLIGEKALFGEVVAAETAGKPPPPRLLNSRVGIVESEFENVKPAGAGGLLFQYTPLEEDPTLGCCVKLAPPGHSNRPNFERHASA